MGDNVSKTCVECRGAMSPVVVMDKVHHTGTARALEYRQPDDRPSFWTGRFPTAGQVRAFMCGGCGRIALYGSAADAEPGAAVDPPKAAGH
jgi:hypothetical protein